MPISPASFSTLSHLSLSIEFDITDTDAIIRDPYFGHFADRSVCQFESLESLEVKVRIGGAQVRWIDIQQSCGNQWAPLARVLGHVLSEEGTLLPRLKSVRVVFERIEEEPDMPPDHYFNGMVGGVLSRWFRGLTELDEKGRLEFSPQTKTRFLRF